MFTGLIRELGTIVSLQPTGEGARIVVARGSGDDPLSRGESIAVDGVCLTALPESGSRFAADLSAETLRLTTLGSLASGGRVNLERSLALGDRLGGHIVQGHVDTTGELSSVDRAGGFSLYRWSYPVRYANLVVEKGSIAVDGVSLTVVEPRAGSFAVALIPETLEKTTLGSRRPGDRSNLEFDILAKHVAALVSSYLPQVPR